MRARKGIRSENVVTPTAKGPASRRRAPATRPRKPEVRIFVSYSHADAAVQAKLEKHLAVLQRDAVSTWFDGDMLAGDAIDREIGRALRNAHVFVALVSSDYLHSRYCQLEYRRAMGRRARGKIRVAAVVVRHCDWAAAPMAAFKLLPHDGRAVSDFRSPDKPLAAVVRALRDVVKAVRAKMPSQGAATPRAPARPKGALAEGKPQPPRPTPRAGKSGNRAARDGPGVRKAKRKS